MKTLSIVAGGSMHKKFLRELRQSDMVIGVDRGALWLIRQGIAPDLAIGDFDSVTVGEKREIRKRSKTMHEFPSRKDATDLELAVDEAVRRRPDTVYLYGVLGRRFDHALAATSMLMRLLSHNIKGEIVDNFSRVNIVRRQEKISRVRGYRYVSVLPIGRDAVVTMDGFVYNVTRNRFIHDSSLGISNEMFGEFATVTVHRGAILVIRSKE